MLNHMCAVVSLNEASCESTLFFFIYRSLAIRVMKNQRGTAMSRRLHMAL